MVVAVSRELKRRHSCITARLLCSSVWCIMINQDAACNNCGQHIKPSAKFRAHCGALLTDEKQPRLIKGPSFFIPKQNNLNRKEGINMEYRISNGELNRRQTRSFPRYAL